MASNKEIFRIIEPVGDNDYINVEISKQYKTSFTGSEIIDGKSDIYGNIFIKFSKRIGGTLREWQGLNKAFNHQIPTTPPLFIVMDENNHLGIVTQKVEGESLINCGEPKLLNNLGKIIKYMHQSVSIEGIEWDYEGKKTFSYYDKSLERWQEGSEADLSPKSIAYTLLKKFYELTKSSHNQITPAFVHYDLHDDQVLRLNDCLTILDFEEWKEAHPLNDLAIYIFHLLRMRRPTENFIAFLDGYSNGQSLSENDKCILAFHLLFYSMRGVETYSQLWPEYIEYSKRYLTRSVNFISQEFLWKI